MKMSANSLRHKSKGKHYDIDGFISQLLASRKFDDLAEKLAEKAANRILLIDAAPSAAVERAIDDNDVDKSLESTLEVNPNREDVHTYENTQLNNVKLRKDFTAKIDPQAVINATISLSENLQLKYKYLKKNALENKVRSNRDSLLKNDTKEDPTKQNMTTEPANFRAHNNKTERRTYIKNASKNNQNDTKKESIDERRRSRAEKKEDRNRNSRLNKSSYSGSDGDTNDSSKKSDHSLEEQGPAHGLAIFRASQNSGPEDMSIVEQDTSHLDNRIKEEKPSSIHEENQKHMTRSEEKITEEVEKSKGEHAKRSMEEIHEDENVIAHFRARDDSIEGNKVTSDYNPHGSVYRSKVSDESDDRSSEERSSEDQSSNEQSGEDLNSSKSKPVIRKEGDKLYTYVRAPEYEDYHEKLAKWQKQHPENPADFMK